MNINMQNELLSFFQNYLNFYKEFLILEQAKYEDLKLNKLHKLDQHVKDEQAYMLKSKGLELERDKLLEKAGHPNLTFSQLISHFSNDLINQVQKIYDELSSVLFDLKDVNTQCNCLTELKLHRVETERKKMEKHPELQKLYNEKAHDEGNPSSILSKKI